MVSVLNMRMPRDSKVSALIRHLGIRTEKFRGRLGARVMYPMSAHKKDTRSHGNKCDPPREKRYSLAWEVRHTAETTTISKLK